MIDGRLACIVPFCQRTKDGTRSPAGAEWICGDHWRLVSPMVKAGLRRVRKRLARAQGDHRQFLIRMGDRFWDRAKTQAIERTVGISA